MSRKPIYIIAPVPSLTSLLRTTKIKALLEERGRPLVHLGWRRDPSEKVNEAPVETWLILDGGGYKNSGLAKWYLKYTIAAYKEMSRIPKGSDVYCLTFWSALGPWLKARSRNLSLFFDNNDNVAMAYPWPGPIKGIVAWMEQGIVRNSRVHLVPGPSRWKHGGSNLRVVPNVPNSDIASESESIASSRGYKRDEIFTLYVNGWLTEERGLTAVVRALEAAPDLKIKVIIAGRVDAEEGSLGASLIKHPKVEYLGKVSPAESLALYRRAHAVLTFYDPAIAINRLAEANKWGDCALTGTTFIVNSEVETVDAYKKAGACFAVPFADTEALVGLLGRLAENPSEAIEAGEKLKAFASAPWEVLMNRVVDDWLGPCQTSDMTSAGGSS